MTSISFAILWRMALAGVLVCLLVGAGFYFIQGRGVNDFVLTLTAPQSDELAKSGVDRDDEAVYASILEAVYRRAVVAQVFDNEWNLRGENANPRFDYLRTELVGKAQIFPRDTERHQHVTRVGEVMTIQIQMPILDVAKTQIGILSGTFAVPSRIDQQLQQHFRYALLAVLSAVFLTAAVLFPMILLLNRKVLQASRNIMRGNLEMAETLGTAIAKRDSGTGDHNYRVCYYALRLGEAAKLDAIEVRRLIIGAFFHDVGKIGVSDTILLKPGKLSAEEFAEIKKHVSLGLEIVRPSEWLRAGSDVIEFHHEKFDGSGYLKQLRGEEIPLVARIFAIVDVFDALASRRPYKGPLSSEEAIAMVRKDAGSHFDPRLVDLFASMAVDLHREITNIGDGEVGRILLQKISYYFLPPDKIPLLP